MRLHVVSDSDGADALLCLGDLILFMDYDDHAKGIMGSLFGADAVGRMIALRTDRRFDEARQLSRSLWSALEGDSHAVVEQAVRDQYAALFAVFPTPTYLTFGNVDLTHLYADYLREGITLLDGQSVELAGRRVGFVGGGLQTPMRTPYEVPDDDYAAKVSAIGKVDVLCSHVPPQIPDLLYDVRAERYERGSEALLAAIETTQPAYALFGHVHQPRVQQMRIGRTRCINVGHFRARGTPFVLDLEE